MVSTVIAGSVAGYAVYQSIRPSQESADKAAEAQASAENNTARQAMEKKLAEASEARRAMANPYIGCAVTNNVVDTHTAKVYDDVFRTPRNEVILTVQATKNPAIAAIEAKYAAGTPDGHLVRWSPVTPVASQLVPSEADPRVPARGELVANTSEIIADTDTTTTFSIRLYPRVDEKRTTTAEISLNTMAYTIDNLTDQDAPKQYVAEGIRSCGVVYEDVDISSQEAVESGAVTWQVGQGGVERLPEFTIEETVK
jgi:hypothetical protein